MESPEHSISLRECFDMTRPAAIHSRKAIRQFRSYHFPNFVRIYSFHRQRNTILNSCCRKQKAQALLNYYKSQNKLSTHTYAQTHKPPQICKRMIPHSLPCPGTTYPDGDHWDMYLNVSPQLLFPVGERSVPMAWIPVRIKVTNGGHSHGN